MYLNSFDERFEACHQITPHFAANTSRRHSEAGCLRETFSFHHEFIVEGNIAKLEE